MNRNLALVRVTLVSAILLSSLHARAETSRSLDQALAEFVTAFDNLDWKSFRACFAPDATVFHPAAPNLKRTDTREAFERAWLGVFERIRKNSGRTAPPYMDLKPQEVRIDNLSEDVALVTFHLDEGGVLGRRTIVWKRIHGDWKIEHIHASNLKAQ